MKKHIAGVWAVVPFTAAGIFFLKMLSFLFGDKYDRHDYFFDEVFGNDLACIIVLTLVGVLIIVLSRSKKAAED